MEMDRDRPTPITLTSWTMVQIGHTTNKTTDQDDSVCIRLQLGGSCQYPTVTSTSMPLWLGRRLGIPTIATACHEMESIT
jgi:hypothetical protein